MSTVLPVRAHAALGASSAHRWMACPGSVALCEGIPDTETDYAKEGTCAHHVLEQALTLGMEPDDFVGMVFDGIEVTQEMAEAVTVCTDYVRSRMAGPGFQKGGVIRVEQRVDLAPFGAPEPMYGTADITLHWPPVREGEEGMLEVVDYKHGAGVAVYAERNPQLRYYLLGASAEFPAAKPYVGTIVQPRVGTPAVRSIRMDLWDLLEWAEELMAAARRTQDPDAPLIPGEKQCRFCPAQGVCPELRSQALTVAQEEFLPVQPHELTPAQVGELLEQADLVEKWIAALRAHAYQEAERGRIPPGWKLVEKQSRRYWKDEEEVSRAARGWENGTELLMPRKLVSPAQAEKILGREAYLHHLSEHVESRSSGTKLVHDDHPAPAVASGPAAEFEALEELI